MKKLEWVGSSKRDLSEMPDEVKEIFGYALYVAQIGSKHCDAKPLKGFGSAGVLEVVESTGDGTFRAVYTVKYDDAVYVLHCFQKKSPKGSVTPKPDMNLIRTRLQHVESLVKQRLKEK